jgi:rhomboid protease GluP
MPSTPVPDPVPAEPLPGNLVVVGRYATALEGFDHGLVALAVGHPYWLIPAGGRYELLVEAADPDEVRRQLELFDRESAGWPPPAPEAGRPRRLDFAAPLVWALVVMGVYWCQSTWPDRLEDAGALDAQAVVVRHEWWRALTALFLHADTGHLVSNLVSGIFAFAVVLAVFGRWRGGCLILLAAASGNLAMAALNFPGPYRSLGASTAIFAGLGLLSGQAVRASFGGWTQPNWKAVLVPLGAALTLLGLYGVGGLQVDVGAHTMGLLAGLLWGFGAGKRRAPPPSAEGFLSSGGSP